jgi:MFS transporter, PAT family, beta-lactamase induction signal transducer AmpG
MAADREVPGVWGSLASMFRSWRLSSVALLSFSSGLPLGLVWIAVPTWMAQAGVDIKVVGLFTLAQAPWSFKFLWAPLMDRFPPPFLGKRRGWIFLSQLALLVLGLVLAAVSHRSDAVGMIGAITLLTGLAAATQDIAIDAYAVDVLRRDEQGAAVGARTALYRAAMFLSGGVAITLAAPFGATFAGRVFHWPGSWGLVNLLLALCFVPSLWLTLRSPEPEEAPPAPRRLRDAVWGAFLGFLGQHRAVEILAFVVLYKLSDNLTQALTRPFLVQTGFGPVDVGVATATIGLVATLIGTVLGGLLTDSLGLGRALWIFGFFQIVSNLGYALVAEVGPNRWLMYAAIAFEMGSTGLGSGAFGVLLLRLTQKRFSATQYALLSSLFTLPRVLAGPVAGVMADAIGWRDFFIFTIVTGIPGMVMLGRFVPWGVRDPVFQVAAPRSGRRLSRRSVVVRAALGGTVAWGAGLVVVAVLGGLAGVRGGRSFDLLRAVAAVLRPGTLGEWTTAVGLLILGLGGGLATAAVLSARQGDDEENPPLE